MEVIALQSGSNGNCIYVESGGIPLLFDAGISGKRAEERLAAAGREIRDVQALVVSHEHRDHVSGVGIFQRKFGLPIHVTGATLRAAGDSSRLGTLRDVRRFEAGRPLRLEHLTIETIPTPHDAVDGVGFVVDDGNQRLGILTDLGHPFDGLVDVLRSLDAVILESNYDGAMLAASPYPPMLKTRISGRGGHLSNDEAARVLKAAGCSRLQWVCLGHLSAENNHPALAADAHRQRIGTQLPVVVASRTAATDVLSIG